MVKVDCRLVFHSVVHAQKHLRWSISDCGGNGRDPYRGQVTDHILSREYNHWPLLVRPIKPAKIDIASFQSSGHAAISSQGLYSSTRLRLHLIGPALALFELPDMQAF